MIIILLKFCFCAYISLILPQILTVGIVYLHLGSNEGNRVDVLAESERLISVNIGSILSGSKMYETEAWGVKEQPDFLNKALEVVTNLSPHEVLKEIQSIESLLGRKEREKWGQRMIDIDILLYDEVIIDTDQLKIPHPLMEKRNFVLIPMLEIAGNAMHPIFKKTIEELYDECKDDCEVMIFEPDI